MVARGVLAGVRRAVPGPPAAGAVRSVRRLRGLAGTLAELGGGGRTAPVLGGAARRRRAGAGTRSADRGGRAGRVLDTARACRRWPGRGGAGGPHLRIYSVRRVA